MRSYYGSWFIVCIFLLPTLNCFAQEQALPVEEDEVILTNVVGVGSDDQIISSEPDELESISNLDEGIEAISDSNRIDCRRSCESAIHLLDETSSNIVISIRLLSVAVAIVTLGIGFMAAVSTLSQRSQNEKLMVTIDKNQKELFKLREKISNDVEHSVNTQISLSMKEKSRDIVEFARARITAISSNFFQFQIAIELVVSNSKLDSDLTPLSPGEEQDLKTNLLNLTSHEEIAAEDGLAFLEDRINERKWLIPPDLLENLQVNLPEESAIKFSLALSARFGALLGSTDTG